MFKMNVKVDLKGVNKKLRNNKQAQARLDQIVLKDSNQFAPMQEGTLITSSLTASKIGQGQLIWDTPYARRLYWNPQYNFSKNVNPNARGLWFEAAKSVYLHKWLEEVKRGY